MTLRGLLLLFGFTRAFFFCFPLLEKNNDLFAISFQMNKTAKDFHFHQNISKRKLLSDRSMPPFDVVGIYIRIDAGFGLLSGNSSRQIAADAISLRLARETATPAHGAAKPNRAHQLSQ